jgi:hypothetical protein
MASTIRKVFEPGYLIRNRVAIYGGGHVSQGAQVWDLWQQYSERYGEVWLEFGSTLSWAHYKDKELVEVEPAYCTGLNYRGVSHDAA